MMKEAYQQFSGWDIEVPYKTGGETFRIDAMNERKKIAREFVHSLDNKYLSKNRMLKIGGLEII